MATVMLMIAMTLAVKVLGYVGQQRRLAEHRQRAVREVANIMERLTAQPFDEITTEQTRKVALSASARETLSDPDLSVAVADAQAGASRTAKRIAVRLRWRGRSGEWEAPVRLTTWIERRRPAS